MPRRIRYIKSNCLYEISFRAENSLPFVCTRYMELIILSTLARVQRDAKVILHHFVWEGSHPHILCTAKDANQCQKFYGEVKKQLTEAIKRLTGLKRLSLWEDRASVIELATLDDAIEKVGYVYANPSNDNLVSTIEHFPGVSSWTAFQKADHLNSCIRTEHKWIRQPMIPKLHTRAVSSKQDRLICEQMLSAAKKSHTLELYPNKWIELFIKAPNKSQVKKILNACRKNLRAREEENSRRRTAEGKQVMGRRRLREQPLLAPHTPKKTGRKIFVQSVHKEARIALIAELNEITSQCRAVYEQWKRGNFTIPWPPGTFPPALPPTANCFGF